MYNLIFQKIFSPNSNISLALSALHILKRWHQDIPSKEFNSFIIELMPVLITFLEYTG